MRQQRPCFSIIIATYARPRQLAACLASLARLDYPSDRFEVIVVDDGSKQPLDDVVAPFRSHLDLTLLWQSNAGAAAARNTGAKQAQGEYLVFTDDDCAPAPDWLQALAARFTTTPDHLIGGRTINAVPDNLYSTASQLLIDYLYEYYNADPSQARFFTGNHMAMPADRFHTLGCFDTTFALSVAEDREFCDRWRRHCYSMTYAPEALIYHFHWLTFRTFYRQHFRYGRGAFHFHQMRAQRDGAQRGVGHIQFEPKSFYLNLLRYPFLHVRRQRAFLLTILLGISQAANVVGFLWEKRQQAEKAG